MTDDRCGAGKHGVHCPVSGGLSRPGRHGLQDMVVERVADAEHTGTCRLRVRHPDGSVGAWFSCTDGSAWQVMKLHLYEI